MKLGPGDYEIDEIGLDEIFEGLIPGSETANVGKEQTQEAENTNTAVDDPFGF